MTDLASGAGDFDDPDTATAHVDLYGIKHSVRWPRDATLVDTLIAAGLDVPFSCKEGHCGSCAATVLTGKVDMAVCDILHAEDLADGVILSCQARPLTDDVHVEF